MSLKGGNYPKQEDREHYSQGYEQGSSQFE